MVQILEPGYSFGAAMGSSLGRGLSEGYSEGKRSRSTAEAMRRENEVLRKQGIDLEGISDPELRKVYISQALQGANAQQLQALKDLSRNERIEKSQEMIRSLYGGRRNEPSVTAKELASAGLPPEQRMQQRQQPERFEDEEIDVLREDLDQNRFSEEDIAMVAASGDENLARLMQAQNQEATKREIAEKREREERRREEDRQRTAKEKQFFKYNEPKLMEVAGMERKIDLDNARFSKLEELFQHKEDFPSSLTASLISKDGTINDIAYSQLSPRAQEAMKLIIDSTSGIKDTYGARVTNFDLATYLKKLPSLLNSPEGKQRILKDLKAINDISQVYNEGIQDVFEEAGGSDKISFSEAERRFKRKYGSEMKRKIDKFVIDENKTMSEKPAPRNSIGRKIRDKETGEVFISDGTQWKLVGE